MTHVFSLLPPVPAGGMIPRGGGGAGEWRCTGVVDAGVRGGHTTLGKVSRSGHLAPASSIGGGWERKLAA